MHTEVVEGITVRPLRNGETETVQRVFDRLGNRSRLLRFGGAKPVLTARDLEQLARVDGDHHVLVALVDCEPIGIARLVRDGAEAEVAVEVADAWQGRRVGTILMARSPTTRGPPASSICTRSSAPTTPRRERSCGAPRCASSPPDVGATAPRGAPGRSRRARQT